MRISALRSGVLISPCGLSHSGGIRFLTVVDIFGIQIVSKCLRKSKIGRVIMCEHHWLLVLLRLTLTTPF